MKKPRPAEGAAFLLTMCLGCQRQMAVAAEGGGSEELVAGGDHEVAWLAEEVAFGRCGDGRVVTLVEGVVEVEVQVQMSVDRVGCVEIEDGVAALLYAIGRVNAALGAHGATDLPLVQLAGQAIGGGQFEQVLWKVRGVTVAAAEGADWRIGRLFNSFCAVIGVTGGDLPVFGQGAGGLELDATAADFTRSGVAAGEGVLALRAGQRVRQVFQVYLEDGYAGVQAAPEVFAFEADLVVGALDGFEYTAVRGLLALRLEDAGPEVSFRS